MVLGEGRRLDAGVGPRRLQQPAVEQAAARARRSRSAGRPSRSRSAGSDRSPDRRAGPPRRCASPVRHRPGAGATRRPAPPPAPRAAVRAPPPRGEASSLMTETRSTRVLCRAGTRPKTSALTHGDQRAVGDDQAVALDVEEQALRRGQPLGVVDQRRESPARPAARPGRRPARRAPGSRGRAAGRCARRVAPRASRTAISPRRDTPRTSTRPAMLAQAIISTSIPIALRMISTGRM